MPAGIRVGNIVDNVVLILLYLDKILITWLLQSTNVQSRIMICLRYRGNIKKVEKDGKIDK